VLGDKPIATLLVSILLFTVLAYAQSPAVSAEVSCEPDEDSSFVLHVVLDDIFNPHRDLHLPIKLNRPFRLSRVSGKVKNTISGELRPCADGKYPLHLTISEWVSEKQNVSGTADYFLQPGKSDGSGLIASVVYNRTVTLVRRADPLRKALARFCSETDVTVKENLLISITSGYPNAGAALLETARNASTADTRWLAIRGIGYLKYQPAVPYLRAALRSKNSYVRANSARALGDMKATLSAQPLLDVLLDERKWRRYRASLACAGGTTVQIGRSGIGKEGSRAAAEPNEGMAVGGDWNAWLGNRCAFCFQIPVRPGRNSRVCGSECLVCTNEGKLWIFIETRPNRPFCSCETGTRVVGEA
jgi:HEAT repeats